MFIRRVKKKNGVTNKVYEYLHLVENIRTEKGPRQKLILNLGCVDINPSLYPILCQRIEELLKGERTFNFDNIDEKIEKIAREACDKILLKKGEKEKIEKERDFKNVDVNSIKVEKARTIGAEYVCNSIWEELKLDDFFKSHNISKNILPVIKAVVIGRLIEPGSELHIKRWAETRSAIYELTKSPLRNSLNSYYRATDRIFDLKDEIERYLSEEEKKLFSLEEKYYFFDLTNSYFEGKCKLNSKAKYGRSKEKRSDCPLIALGLIIDENGFAKSSELFEGNKNEALTLEKMVNGLENKSKLEKDKKRTIVMDAGIASENNLKWLKENGYNYIVVNRGKGPIEIDFDKMEIVKKDEKKGVKIEIKRHEEGGEVYILCRSEKKREKEESMRTRMEELFIKQLEYLKSGLDKPKRMKSYVKVLESIGRIKEKYSSISKLYVVEVIGDEKKEKVVDIKWEKKDELYKKDIESEGSYILRSDRMDLEEKEIWNVYIMLKNIEKAFLNMKSHLGLRPNYHRKEKRIDAHMFISVFSYHIQHIIEFKLREKGETRSWATIRDILSTHNRVTISYDTKENEEIVNRNVRFNTQPELEHIMIYKKLGLPPNPLGRFLLNTPKV